MQGNLIARCADQHPTASGAVATGALVVGISAVRMLAAEHRSLVLRVGFRPRLPNWRGVAGLVDGSGGSYRHADADRRRAVATTQALLGWVSGGVDAVAAAADAAGTHRDRAVRSTVGIAIHVVTLARRPAPICAPGRPSAVSSVVLRPQVRSFQGRCNLIWLKWCAPGSGAS